MKKASKIPRVRPVQHNNDYRGCFNVYPAEPNKANYLGKPIQLSPLNNP